MTAVFKQAANRSTQVRNQKPKNVSKVLKLTFFGTVRRKDEDEFVDEGVDGIADEDSQLIQVTPKDGEYSSFPEIHRKTVDALLKVGYKSLFPIQQHCFYPIYQREDIIARDLTGSGKTIGFSLPTVEYLRRHKLLGTKRVQAIVLVPTRELALQVTREIEKLKHYDNEFKIVTVYGGVNIDEQTRALRNGVDIFVGTTGRVLDHIERGNIDFRDLKTLVLDEADQMLKLGFKEDVDRILSASKKTCNVKELQICLFSATVPYWVKQLAKTYMKRNLRTVDLCQDLTNKTAKAVQHLAIDCPY
jgi:superfamily II DNA/RNA helicase